MNIKTTESEVEEIVLEILSEMKYKYLYGSDIAFDGKSPEREIYFEVALIERLRNSIDKINTAIPQEAKEEAKRKPLISLFDRINKNNIEIRIID